MAEQRTERRLDQPRDPRLRLPRLDPEAFGRWSEAIARFMGTARFIVYMTAVIVIWFAWNVFAPARVRFDPYTFTFLTLILSLQASYAAPLILLAQNRLADRDRLALEEDRRRAAMQKADTEYLAREIASLRVAVSDRPEGPYEDVGSALLDSRDELAAAMTKTLAAALIGFALSTLAGIAIAVLLSSSRAIQRSFYPYAVFFQTVPT